MIPATEHDTATMLRENPNLKFTINVTTTGYRITFAGKAATYILHTQKNVVRVFAKADSVFRWFQSIGATNIDVHMCPALEEHSIC